MPKFLFFSDLHCFPHQQFAQPLANGRNSRFQDCLNIISQAKEVALQERCAAVFFLGDLFHSRKSVDIDVFDATLAAVKDLAESVHTFLLPGNHDLSGRVAGSTLLTAFKPFCEVLDKPTCKQHAGFFFQSFPYTAEVEKLVVDLKSIPKVDILLLHQAMREGALGCYGKTGHGEIGVGDLPLDKVRYVFAGDYHKRQFLGPNNRVHYIGSPLQLNFGEVGEFKAFTLLDTSDWSVIDIPTAAPRFFVFETPTKYLQAKTEGIIRPEIDFIRILHTEDARESAELIKAESPRVQVVEESAEKHVLQRIGNEIASSDMLLLESYVEQKSDGQDKARLLAIGLDSLWGDTE